MNLTAQIEALLFHFGEAINIKKVALMLGITQEECEKAIGEWATALAADPSRGLTLLRKEHKVQLVTKTEFKSISEAIVKDEFTEELSPAALETLSLIAYLGPIPRATIDYIRGVNSSFTLRALVMRGLIERCDEKGLSLRYRVTEQCMRHMGITSLHELPEHETYRTILRSFEEQASSPAQPTAEKPQEVTNPEQ